MPPSTHRKFLLAIACAYIQSAAGFQTLPWIIHRPISPVIHSHSLKLPNTRLQSTGMARSKRRPSSLAAYPGSFLPEHSFFLTRIVFLRALAFVYGVAFLIAKNQSKALIGDRGIAPAREILDKAEARGRDTAHRRKVWLNSTISQGSPVIAPYKSKNLWERLKHSTGFHRIQMQLYRNPKYQYWRERLWDRQDGLGRPVTTLLWLAKDRNNIDPWLDGIANWGLALSFLVFISGAANVPLLLALWICQRSLMAVGGPFWGFGWEPQLAELGFHALFLVPLLSLDPFCSTCPPSKLVLYTIRWHLFRIMMGAGLIKLRSGDIKWKWPHLSTMNYFYETQPVPNPLTRYFHWMPKWWHKFEVLTNHFVELIAPWLLLVPLTPFRRLGGFIQILFQCVLITSGNLSFLNWLTIVPAITCFDDAYLARLFPASWTAAALNAACMARSRWSRSLTSVLFALWMGYLSIPVVKNLMSKNQVMNGSFGPLRLVNTYGAFGNVDEIRYELIVSASSSLDGPWREYEFKVKPGNVMGRPKFISPYHHRLDWQFWIASTIGNLEYSPWIYSFLLKVLEQDPGVLGLLETNPFENESDPPKYIRIDKYRYWFQKDQSSDGSDRKAYWSREFAGRIFPRQGIATVDSLRDKLGNYN